MGRLSRMLYINPDTFFEEENLLNARNGVIDLKTGEIHSHNPSQKIMSCLTISYDPNADQSFWRAWLVDAVGHEAANWLQLAVGYSLTGSTREEVLFYLYGPPRSGKGTFTETILTMLGAPLAEAIPFDLLTSSRDVDAQNFRLAPLRNTRFVTASESNPYERFNEAKLKALTGGDSLQCAFKRHDPFTYRPKFKIWLSSNQPINIEPTDTAAWGRVRVVEFPNSKIGEEDKGLKGAMRSRDVLEGVLAWAVQGAIKWYALGKTGLTELDASQRLKRSQRDELDNIQSWIEECCTTEGSPFAPGADLYTSYFDWCKRNGVSPKMQRGLSDSLIHKGFCPAKERVGGKQVRGFRGIGFARIMPN